MAKLSSRQQLKDYCLRRLGYPVIEINVDDDQVEDRIEDALDFFHEYHFDGVDRFYFTPQLRLSELFLSTILGNNFQENETITGNTSGATATVVKTTASTLTIKDDNPDTPFTVGETITGSTSGFSTTLHNTTYYFIGELAKEYIDVGEDITGIIRIFPVGSAGSSSAGTTNIFNVIYQFRLNDMYNLLSSDITYYSQVKMHLQLLDDMFAGNRTIRFNRKMNRLYIDVNWKDTFSPNDYVAVEAYIIVDPETFTEVYNDMFLKRYATALIKRQWGNNLKKFQGMQLPGGVQMDGQRMFEEAMEEIRQIETEMQLRYELPVDLMVG
jgi:hypothetical protein